MRPWFEQDLGYDGSGHAISDAMREEGLDPECGEDSKAFVDQANREAFEHFKGDPPDYALIHDVDPETGEIYPPGEGLGGYFERSWVGRQLLKG